MSRNYVKAGPLSRDDTVAYSPGETTLPGGKPDR